MNLYMFICGRRSLSDGDKGKNGSYISPQSTPKISKKSKILSRFMGKDSRKRNPYAERGLERFHRLLADVEEEKHKIYRQIGAEEISFVRFVYSDSFKHVRPVVVRVKNNSSHLKLAPSSNSDEEIGDEREEKGVAEEKKGSRLCIGVMMVLVLVFVAIHGRSFAILCTTIMCYLLPVIFGERLSQKNTPNVGRC